MPLSAATWLKGSDTARLRRVGDVGCENDDALNSCRPVIGVDRAVTAMGVGSRSAGNMDGEGGA